MKVVRYFIHAENQETGMVGYLPLWIPRSANFDPSYELNLALHDCLEHRLCDSGKPHEEAMAFGRLLALRVVSGSGDGRADARSLGQEFAGVMANIYQSGNDEDILKEPPKVGRIFDEYVGEEIRILVATCAKSLRSDLDARGELEMPDPVVFTRLAHWLQIGYIDAHRRYGGARGCSDMGDVINRNRRSFTRSDGAMTTEQRRFVQMAGDAEDAGTEAEECLRITVDTDTSEVKLRAIRKGEYGHHPLWLREKIRRWRTA
jgi:hypothetical protein